MESKAHSIPDPPLFSVGLQQFTLVAYREERESGAFPFLASDCSDLENDVTKIAMDTTNAANCRVVLANECLKAAETIAPPSSRLPFIHIAVSCNRRRRNSVEVAENPVFENGVENNRKRCNKQKNKIAIGRQP